MESKKVAFDAVYSDSMMGKMARAGHQVVCVAQVGEPDAEFFQRAINSGAEIIFSRDNDLVKLKALSKSDITIINDEKGIIISSIQMEDAISKVLYDKKRS